MAFIYSSMGFNRIFSLNYQKIQRLSYLVNSPSSACSHFAQTDKSKSLLPEWSPHSALQVKTIHTSQVKMTDKIKVTFQTENGATTLEGNEEDSLLDIVKNNNFDIPGYGACDGTLACSTCQVVLSNEAFDILNKGIPDEEIDIIEMANENFPTSRLGCQVYLTKAVDGMKVIVPEITDIREA